jgi:outer membrane protein
MNTMIAITTSVLVAALAAHPEPARATDLLDSYRHALDADPSRQAADAALLAGREKAVQGRSLLLPQVGLTAGVTRVRDRSDGSAPSALQGLVPSEGQGTVTQAALQLAQPLYDAKAAAQKRQMQQQAGVAEVQHRHAQQDLMQRVGDAYFDLLLARDGVVVAEAEKAAVALQRDRAQARFDVGRGKVTDLQEAQARYDGVLAKELSARSTLSLREATYRELTGRAAGTLAAPGAGFVPPAPQPDDLAAWQGRGQQGNTRVLVKQAELAMAAAEIDKYRLAGRPTLDVVGSYAYKGQNGGLSPVVAPDGGRSAALGLQLNVPLFAGGAIDSREREAIARRHQAEHELRAAERDTRLQVQNAFLAVKTGVARVAALEASVLSARSALEATTLGRDVGTRTELDVLDAQQRLYATQLDLAQARHGYLTGRLRLAFAAGQLDEGELQSLNTHLQP